MVLTVERAGATMPSCSIEVQSITPAQNEILTVTIGSGFSTNTNDWDVEVDGPGAVNIISVSEQGNSGKYRIKIDENDYDFENSTPSEIEKISITYSGNECGFEPPLDENSLTLTSVCVEEEYSNPQTKWRIINDSGVDVDYQYEIYSEGISGNGTVPAEHTMEERFDNPYYFYVDAEHPVTLKIYWGDELEFSETKASGGAICEPEELEGGSIEVCKVIADRDGNVATSADGLPKGKFEINLADNIDFDDADTVTFNAETFSPNTTIFSSEDDAECHTVDGLDIAEYFYSEESITKGHVWLTPEYNDQFYLQVGSVNDFFEYSSELFDDGDPEEERNKDADGHIVLSESRPHRRLVVLNSYEEPEPMVNLHAYKVMCESESDFPEWVKDANYPSMLTEELIMDYVEDSEGACWFEPGWEFEWAEKTVSDPGGDYIGYGGDDWNTFGPTNEDGLAMTQLDFEDTVWVREVLQEGYLPFSDEPGGAYSESAELICHTDGYNYDNYERLDDPVFGEDYYCAAFNTLIEEPEPKATIFAHKVVCEDESHLPNWGDTPEGEIDEATAINFVSENSEYCRLEPNWQFEWGYDGEVDKKPGDFTGPAGGNWHAFDTVTGSTPEEPAKAYITDLKTSDIWVREILKDGYLPFSSSGSEIGDSYSAEFYCHQDVYKYDNFDRVEGVELENEYYCVGFNVLEEPEPDTATIRAHKVICEDESDLPDWVKDRSYPSQGEPLTEQKVIDYVNNSEGRCRFTEKGEDWSFQWGYDGEVDKKPGDFTGPAGGNWHAFENKALGINPALATVNLEEGENVRVREVLQEGYLPFSDEPGGAYSESAELICHTDGFNYDNYEYVDGMEADGEYICVAFNVPEEEEPVCEDIVIVSDETNEVYQEENNEMNSYIGPFGAIANAVKTFVHDNWTSITGAEWIWKTEEVENPEEDEVYYFEKHFDIHGTVSSATLEVAVDNSYKVWINDELIDDRFNVEDNYSETRIYSIDSGKFDDTENVIKFKVKNWEQPGGTWETNPAGLLYRLDIERNTCYEPDPEPETGRITAHKIEASVQPEELETMGVPNLDGWTITIEDLNNDYEDDCITEDGAPCVFDELLLDRTYRVCEVMQDGWRNVSIHSWQGDLSATDLVENELELCVDVHLTSEEAWVKFANEEYEDEEPVDDSDATTPARRSGGTVLPRTTTTEEATVTFDENHEEGDLFEITVEKDTSLGDEMPVNPVREGYLFLEWNTESDGEGQVFDADTPVSEDITAYAIWAEEEILGEEECGIYLNEFIRFGADNNPEEVRKLQIFLNIYMGEDLEVSGIYDTETMEAVNGFQLLHKDEILQPWVDEGLHDDINEPTGYVFETTRRKINMIMCEELGLPIPDLSGYALTAIDDDPADDPADDPKPAEEEEIDDPEPAEEDDDDREDDRFEAERERAEDEEAIGLLAGTIGQLEDFNLFRFLLYFLIAFVAIYGGVKTYEYLAEKR